MKILFICTHNRCRSILAEALTRHMSEGRIDARSAGSQPAGVVFPGTLKYLESQNISTEGLVSQSWDDHEAFAPDVVITVCDSAAGETCPVWFGNAARVHWGLPDPSKLPTEDMQQDMFKEVGRMMQQRLSLLASTSLDEFTDKKSLETAIGRLLTPEHVF